MADLSFSFLTPEDYSRIAMKLKDFEIDSDIFLIQRNDFVSWTYNQDIETWVNLLVTRVYHAEMSFVHANSYLERGIPDEPWYVKESPGHFRFFPNFSNLDHHNLEMFNYFTDTFFYKVFSVLETLAHILFDLYKLPLNGREKKSFHSAIDKLNVVCPQLFDKLNTIRNTDTFKLGSKIRNDHTHNFPFSNQKSGVTKSKNKVSFSIKPGDYTPSRIMNATMLGMWDCLSEIILAVTEELKQNHPIK